MSVQASYKVSGMTCAHCVRSVTDELRRLPGVETVEVDLAKGDVSVTSNAPLHVEAVRTAIDEAGYVLAGPRV